MSDRADDTEHDGGRKRPFDPAGTRPKHSEADLLPKEIAPLLAPPVAPHLEEPVEEAPEGRIRTRASRRVGFALGVLAALGLAFAVGGVLLAVSSDKENAGAGAPHWSAWEPRDGGEAPSSQIADHVGREYRLGKTQLVLVTGGRPKVADVPMDLVLQPANGELTVVPGSAVLYRLCGLGPNCAIAKGRASTDRHLLLRREALELALYSFRYINGLQNAVVLMPPRLGSEDPGQALFFRKDDLDPALDVPLNRTLHNPPPSVSSIAGVPESVRVDKITTSKLYQYSISTADSDLKAYLVLAPMTATANEGADSSVTAILSRAG